MSMNVDLLALEDLLVGRNAVLGLQHAGEAFCGGEDVALVGGSEHGKTRLVVDICSQLEEAESDFLVLVAPLRAHILVMKEQCDARGVPAIQFSSTAPYSPTGSGPVFKEEKARVRVALAGHGDPFKLLLISIDRVADKDIVKDLQRAQRAGRLKGIVVDDVQDYRNAIKHLNGGRLLKARFPGIPIMAIASPATSEDLNEIAFSLALKGPRLFHLGLSKRNIALEVRVVHDDAAKLQDLEAFIVSQRRGKTPAHGVIFCRPSDENKACKDLAQDLHQKTSLQQLGCSVEPFYYKEMPLVDQKKLLRRFLNNDVLLVCSPGALGVGVDKRDLRWVVHWDLPPTKYGLYSEVSRAGRDGQPARSILYATPADLLQGNAADPVIEYAFHAACRKETLWGDTCQEWDEQCDLCRQAPAADDGGLAAGLNNLGI